MTISYPVTLPTSIGIADIRFTAKSVTAKSESPFTLQQQILNWGGQRLEATITIPPCKRDLAEEWVAFLLSLKGHVGTFFLNDPNCTSSQGAATGLADFILVNGANQTGSTLNVDGLTTEITDYFKAGDYIQIGLNSEYGLYKVLQDVDSNSLGEAILSVWPDVRTAPPDNTSIITSSPKGIFRLKNPDVSWSIDNISSYGIQFEAVEAL